MDNEEQLAADASEETLDTETVEVDETETETETETEAEVEVVDTSVSEEETEGEPASKRPRNKNRRQVRRLLNKTDKLTTELEQSNSQIQNLQSQINNMQQGAPQQAPVVSEKMPVLTEFYNDEDKYQEAMQTWHQGQINKNVNAQMQQFTQNSNAQQQAVLAEQRQQNHYQAADDLQVSDYEDAEATAIKLLGNNLANEVVNRSDNSATVMYHFGKNPQAAIEFANLAQRDAVSAAVKLGQLSGSLKVRPKVSSGRVAPESKIEGSSASKAPSATAFQKQYDAAVKEATKNGDIAPMKKVRREAKAAGVTVS